MACPLCKMVKCGDCLVSTTWTATGFYVRFLDCHRDSLIVPCIARRQFSLQLRPTVLFSTHGSSYNIRVSKRGRTTIFHGKQWKKFIADHSTLGEGDLVMFTMIPRPKICLVYVENDHEPISSEDNEIVMDSSEEDDDGTSSANEIGEDQKFVVARRVRLTTHEQHRLSQLRPVGRYLGILFVTRFTITNLMIHDMMARQSVLRAHGNAGLRLVGAGEAVNIAYTKRSDGRIDLDKLGWKNFIQGKNIQAGQPVLIILRKTSHLDLHFMIEMVIV